jgi:glycosyltransferase involved in cell wall biosynthesis
VASSRFRRRERNGRTAPARLGYVGRPDPIKGIFVLARAVALLPRELDFTLELRGPFGEEDRRRLRRLAGDDPRLRFELPVSPAEVPQVLESFDALICPSIALEGGPTVALEAHAVGTPVIGSRIGGLAEIIEDGVYGLLVGPGDARALAKAIERVVERDGEILARFRKHLPEPRTMDQIAEDYLRIYEKRR